MLAVLDVAKGVVMGAIKAAKGIADFLGTFVVLIKDIAKAPGQWISNLGAAVMDGVKNHLWKAFKTTVKGWFDAKLEEVLGVGTTIWNVLKQGGISLKQVGQMAFEALKAAIPSALIQLLIEKLVAMIVPAAGAVMAIIEGLQAAWPAVQRVIAAVGLFVVFLKAVKPGGAGPQFATMLAAGAVVVIDFVATWLLKKLRGPASKVGSKVKAIAQKIIARIKKALKKAGGWVKGKFKGLKKKFDDWKAKRKAKKDAKKKGKEDPSKKKQDKTKQQAETLAAAKAEAQTLLRKPMSRLMLRLRLVGLRIKYGLKGLKVASIKGHTIKLQVNPFSELSVEDAKSLGKDLEPVLVEAERIFIALYKQTQVKTHGERGAEDPPQSTKVDRVLEWRDAGDLGFQAKKQGDPFSKIKNHKLQHGEERVATSWNGLWTLASARLHSPDSKTLSVYYKTMRSKNQLGGFSSFNDMPANQAAFIKELGTLERARKEGMMPAMDVAEGLMQKGAATPSEVVHGNLAPMATDGSGIAAHRDDKGTDFKGDELRADPSKQKEADKRDATAGAAREVRHERIGNIFHRLRQAVSTEGGNILSSDKSALAGAMRELAKALKSWLDGAKGQIEDGTSPEQLKETLVFKLVAYMKAFGAGK
jgi:hypothetical protein